MYGVLTQLFQQVEMEKIANLETLQLADAFLIALTDCKDIHPSQIISEDSLKSALGYERDYPPPLPL